MSEFFDLTRYNDLMPEVDRHETPQAWALGELLMRLFSIRSVIDVGCATGVYLLPFQKAGLDVYGIDGAPLAGQHIPNHFELVDFRNPWTPPRPFDLALCIEVGEHMKAEHADTLIGTIARCAPLVFWSAATPGQGGWDHVNEQPEQYWVDKFGQVGYVKDDGHTSAVHAVIDHDPAYEHCHWLQWHSTMFRRA